MTDNSGVVIEASQISKQFQLSAAKAGDLRELLTGLFQRKAGGSTDAEAFYALRDVSFSIRKGEAVGIVGHNGSGKSTLLKMLTGILKPDTGSLKTRGRVGALIEVGAGFHPDLSGRENVFLNGSILGLSRREIAEKFDEIVAFSNLERFIDTPVKRYSSGMFMRLGFAIATHLDPDILLIDEVLAVGDTQFQRKCIQRLQEFTAAGGTAIFVSHSMGQVAEVCPRCLWLDHGKLLYDGASSEAVDRYMAVVAEREEEEFRRRHPEEWAARQEEKRLQQEQELAAIAAQEAAEAEAEAELVRLESRKRYHQPDRSRLLGITLRDANGRASDYFEAGQPLHVEIAYRMTKPLPCPAFCLEIFRKSDGLHMFTTSNYDHDLKFPALPNEGTVRLDIPFLSLSEGEYTIRLRLYSDWKTGAWDEALEDQVNDAASIRVSAGRFGHGCTYIPVRWEPAIASSSVPVEEIRPENARVRWEVAVS